MGRVYTREGVLVAARAAVARLGEGSSRGGLWRYDDELFRFAVAYLWLRSNLPAEAVWSQVIGTHNS